MMPDTPPDRWMCPKCHGIIEDVVYTSLPRRLVRGPGGKHTEVVCPLCQQPTAGVAWTIVELTGTDEIT